MVFRTNNTGKPLTILCFLKSMGGKISPVEIQPKDDRQIRYQRSDTGPFYTA